MALPEISHLRDRINHELSSFTEVRKAELLSIGSELIPVAESMSAFITDGGKRFRPIFANIGYLGAGHELRNEVLRASIALELVHVCALIHDDLMDGSDMRRNRPAIHKFFEKVHTKNSYEGVKERFGAAAAILLGDLALVWADRAFHESGISNVEIATSFPIFTLMREELMAGQYLDVLEGALATRDIERSLKVARFKSGKYSIERPLHFGAALANGSTELLHAYSDYGLPLGEAFQLRDDILGVFGDQTLTGKPSGDDLREGKRTVLIAMTFDMASSDEKEKLSKYLGSPDLSTDAVIELQRIITSCGALQRCESLITELRDRALLALRSSAIDRKILPMLEEMALVATERNV